MFNRQIVLDTETTGLDPAAGHRVIEIGGIEIVNRRPTGRHIHFYLHPDRAIDPEAQRVHGISSEFLADKPRFAEVAEEFLEFVRAAELVIHNAPFDIGFLDHELRRWGGVDSTIRELCDVLDTLELARLRHPGQRNSLDALCKRYNIDNSRRELHGALLDAEILADVYLAMTREQGSLMLDGTAAEESRLSAETRTERGGRAMNRRVTRVIRADASERVSHERWLDRLGDACLWRQTAE
jgi:DNA polymerase III subunit epsilon